MIVFICANLNIHFHQCDKNFALKKISSAFQTGNKRLVPSENIIPDKVIILKPRLSPAHSPCLASGILSGNV